MVFRKVSHQGLLFYVNMALGVLLIAAGLFLARDFLSHSFGRGEGKRQSTASEGLPSPAPEIRAFQSYAPILENNVFGFDAGRLSRISSRSLSTPVNKAAGSNGAVLKLFGTVAWPGGMGYAFISGAADGLEVYRTGDRVHGVGNLSRVEPNMVYIDSDGGEVRLDIVDIGESSPAAAPRRRANRFARKTAERSYVLDKKVLQGSFDNPKNIMTDARLLPNIVDGVQQGFVVREVKTRGLYHNLGIRNGDVLLRVNEFDISDAETALQAFNALRGMDKIDLDILRGGSRQTLTYEIR
jgi:general secretion pathway protein C